MKGFIKIFLSLLLFKCLNTISGKPIFGEFGFKKNFDFIWKPIPFKPIEFLKETFTPIGHFAVKHVIGKRELGNVNGGFHKQIFERKLKEELFKTRDYGKIKEELLKILPYDKQIEFFKEKWSPFGKFGSKHAIGKRDLDQIKTLENDAVKDNYRLPAKVYEDEEPEGRAQIGLKPLITIPVTSNGKLIEEHKPVEALPISVSSLTINQESEHVPITIEPKLGVIPLKPLGVEPVGITSMPKLGPVPTSPYTPIVNITPRSYIIKESVPLYTDIGRDEQIGSYLKDNLGPFYGYPEKENNIIPQKPKEVEKEEINPFVRGSQLALYFGNLFYEYISQLFTRKPNFL